MSPYERRRGGNASPGGLEAAPARVTPVPGKGALGTRWPRQSAGNQTQCWVLPGLRRGEGAMQTPPRRGEGCASTAVSRAGGRSALRNGVQNRGQNRTREIRPSGIVEGLQETWPVGASSTRRARLISISTSARWDLCGGRAEPESEGPSLPRPWTNWSAMSTRTKNAPSSGALHAARGWMRPGLSVRWRAAPSLPRRP